MSDLFANVIDERAAVESLRMFLDGDDSFVAAGLIRFWCGHTRPTNVMREPGDEMDCLLCGPQTVERVDLIEPTVFPHPDALSRLHDEVPAV